MNKRIANPLIVNITAPTEDKKVVQNGRRFYVPTNAAWSSYKDSVGPALMSDAYDSVIVHVNQGIDLDEKGAVNGISIKLNDISRAASNMEKPVLSDATKDTWYLMNPSWDDQKEAHGYAPSDDVILEKFHSYETELDWQAHQAGIWSRMADMMPLLDGKFAFLPDHVSMLTDPSRGLEKSDLDEFWSFRSNTMLTPALMGDDMVGMPGIVGNEYDGFTMVTKGADGSETEHPLQVKSLKTIGMSGAAIPMPNVEGNVPKYQIATDPSKINVVLKARAADGVSIQKSEYFNKKTNQFKFKMADGQESHLHVQDAKVDGTVTFADVKGDFQAHMKDDVLGTLKERGYNIPPLIAKLQVVPNAKYIWQSKGTMVGSDEVCKTVSPSNAGFTIGREPKNGADDWIVLVAEGALKGRIVAKYVDVKDRDGHSFGDFIAKDRGIIVAQVPGVSEAFVESVKPIYDKYKVRGTYIAMDADGRENLAVARGIDTAYRSLSACSDTLVMSWNPEQKGMDDALLAVAQGKITLKEMGLHFGTPEKLFPKEGAKAPNPYRLDGTRANRQEWQVEYTKDSRATNAKIKALQEETKRRAAELAGKGAASDTKQRADVIGKGGDDLAKNLPIPDEDALKQ